SGVWNCAQPARAATAASTSNRFMCSPSAEAAGGKPRQFRIVHIVILPQDMVGRELHEEHLPLLGRRHPVGPDLALHARELVDLVRRTEEVVHRLGGALAAL